MQCNRDEGISEGFASNRYAAMSIIDEYTQKRSCREVFLIIPGVSLKEIFDFVFSSRFARKDYGFCLSTVNPAPTGASMMTWTCFTATAFQPHRKNQTRIL